MDLELRMLEESSGREKMCIDECLKKTGRSGTKQEGIGENDEVD